MPLVVLYYFKEPSKIRNILLAGKFSSNEATARASAIELSSALYGHLMPAKIGRGMFNVLDPRVPAIQRGLQKI